MGLDLYVIPDPCDKCCQTTGYHNEINVHITGNLCKMCEEVFISPAHTLYDLLWKEYDRWENEIFKDSSLFKSFIVVALGVLYDNPDHYKQFNPSCDWGSYESLLESLKTLLKAIEDNSGCYIKRWV